MNLANYLETLTHRDFQDKMIQHGLPTWNGRKEKSRPVPDWMNDWLMASGKYTNTGSIKDIANEIVMNKIESPKARVVLMEDGNYYSSKSGSLVHNSILAYLMYNGTIKEDEETFKNWRKDINVATTVPFIMLQPHPAHPNFICISESYYLKKTNPVLKAVAELITKPGNKFEKGIKKIGLKLCPFGVDTPDALAFIKGEVN